MLSGIAAGVVFILIIITGILFSQY